MPGERLSHNPIADLNDEFRKACIEHPDPEHLPNLAISIFLLDDFEGAIQAVRDYDDFDAGNDPYGEHDFGAFNWHDERVLWKIDYTDRETGYWRDPLDPECQRVLTILTAADY